MKTRKIRSLLRQADDRTAALIASRYPVEDKAQKERIYQKIKAKQNPAAAPDAEVFTASSAAPVIPAWRHYAGMAAAVAVAFGITGGGILYLLQGVERVPLHTGEELVAAEPTEREAQAEVVTEPAPPPTEAWELTQESLFARCMHTDKYLTQLSGHIVYFQDRNQEGYDAQSIADGFGLAFQYETDIALDYVNDVYYGDLMYYYGDDLEPMQHELTYTQYNRSYHRIDEFDSRFTSRRNIGYYSWIGWPEQSPDNSHRPQITNAEWVFGPRNTATGFLSDMKAWSITGTETFQGRECAVVEGTTDEYGRRWKVTNFKLKIDIETGCWLFYEGYAEDGTLRMYMHTSDMRFGEDAQPVPTITEEEIDRLVEEGYVLSEDNQTQRQQALIDLEEHMAQQVEKDYSACEEPEVMPEPLPPDPEEYPDEYYQPIKDDGYIGWSGRFRTIPPELKALITDEQWAEWEALEQARLYPQEPSTSLLDYCNIYSFVRYFDLPDDDVRAALLPHNQAEAEQYFRLDEIEAIITGNEAAMFDSYRTEGWDYTIVVGTKVYTLFWLYTHPLADYRSEGIPVSDVEALLQYAERWNGFRVLTQEASDAMLMKLRAYVK